MKGAIFDLDGVITDTAKFHFAAWSQLASEKLGLKLPASFETELKGISRIESLERILDFGGLRDKYTAEQVEELAAERLLLESYRYVDKRRHSSGDHAFDRRIERT